MKKPPDILNSKIKKLRIELPHYTFSHSSSGDSSHDFIGRERIRERLKKVIEDSPDEPGVYLIAGNRGVGKTSLVSWVINKTSLRTKSKFIENLRYVILLFLSVIVTQFLISFCLREFPQFIMKIYVIGSAILVLSYITLCIFNSYRYRIPKQTHEIWKKVWNCIKSVFNCVISAINELSYLINPHNPYGKTQYLLKIILIIGYTQIYSIFNPCVTPVQAFIFYMCFVFVFMFWRFIRRKLREYYRRNEKLSKMNHLKKFFKSFFRIIFQDIILYPIINYIKNHSRLYLRMNFGHNLKEKDILRLIARTLNTEYNKYRFSFRRMLPWRVIAFSFLFLFAFLFSEIVGNQEIHKSTKDRENIEIVLPEVETKVETKVDTKIEVKVETKVGAKKGNLSNILNDIASEIKNKTVNISKYLFGNKENLSIDYDKKQKFTFLYDYSFWLSFILMYLFCVLLFRCNWITLFFVTHRIIMRRLKKLNSDITHSTERENSISVNNGNVGSEIGTKIKKSRNVADSREIEKELQDILSDMQRIPFIMCRPNIVIVFDELDKVEPGESGSDKENPQTKASLFSIHATRERQTEILRILSNMKYFLSSARAKFIFIAGREMFDIHLADVSDRNNYIGSIFNVVILVPSFLTDHHTGKKYIPQESSIASLPEEFVCRKLIPYDYPVESFDLENYRTYLKNVIYKDFNDKLQKKEEIQKIIAVLQQFIIYLAHVSKGAPKKMMQLFESFIEISNENDDTKNTLIVQRYHGSRHFLSFNYYKQYTLGIVAYLITPIFYRLAESNIKEHSDKLLVSSLRFVDFLFKFHKHSFSWKHLDMSPEMLEVNRAPELKSVAVELLNYLTQVHINKSNFSLSEYKFDGLIANEIFAMAKTDEVFSALFSFSLDETLPLKKHYQDLLVQKENEYKKKKKTSVYIDAISSLQGVLGDLHYYDDELEEAEAYYKSAVQALRKNKDNGKMKIEKFYIYVRNMLRLGIIYEKRKQYDFAYLTYGELCKRSITKASFLEKVFNENSPNIKDMLFEKMTYDGLKMLYLPFIAKLQILELSHIGGITLNHLKQLDDEFKTLTESINGKEAKLLRAEFCSRVADIIYYKNSDLNGKSKGECSINCSCTACDYYLQALSTLLNKTGLFNPNQDTVKDLLCESVDQLKNNYNVKFCTILARILSDWGNVFFSCDIKGKENRCGCYVYGGKNCNTILKQGTNDILDNCIKYLELEKENNESPSIKIDKFETKKDITFTMYTISSIAYRKAGLYKRSAYQIYKILCLFKDYKIYEYKESEKYIKQLSEQAIHYLWYANDDLNVFELNKRKKDFDKDTIKEKIPLKNILVDSEITRIRVLVKEFELKLTKEPDELKKYYDIHITSPYRINYSIMARIYRLVLKSKVNYEAYQRLFEILEKSREELRKKDFILEEKDYKLLKNEKCNENVKNIFGKYFCNKKEEINNIEIFENLIADSIYCLIDISQLVETMEENYLFPHSFLGSIHEHLSFWIRQYEAYEVYKKENPKLINNSQIDELLDQYLGEEWREQLSGYRENQRALSHYYKCLEMHSEGRAYQNMLDIMVYVKDDFNDRSDHFNIAEERHLIVNGKIDEKINEIKNIYKNSKLYKVDNYFNDIHD